MESEERPRKMRKLSPDVSSENQNGTTNTDADNNNGAANIQSSDAAKPEEAPALPLPSDVISADAGEVDQREVPLSKSQQKKLRKKAEWEAGREERKIIRKEKVQAKRERKREAKEQARAEGLIIAAPKPQVHEKASQLPVTFLLDCDFDDLMRDGERISLASQVTRCYSDNKNARCRAHLTICSFTGKLRERFDTLLTSNYKSWRGVRTFETNFSDVAEKAKEWMTDDENNQFAGVFSKYADIDEEARKKLKEEGEVVYLSSEADDDLMELKPYSTYIVGGLVDKNREKGICYKRARKAGIKTAKLPIGEYMEMQSRKVLATNHVNEIMIKWLECGDWGEAFVKVIPKRKGGKLKDEKETGTPQADDGAEEIVEDERDDGAGDRAEAEGSGVVAAPEQEDHAA